MCLYIQCNKWKATFFCIYKFYIKTYPTLGYFKDVYNNIVLITYACIQSRKHHHFMANNVIGTSLRWLQMSVIVETATYAKNDWPPTLHDIIFIFNIIYILYFNIVEETEF